MVLFNHWFIPYKVERGRLFFRCGTLQAKNDYKCNTWSRQKLSPQLTKLVVFFNRWFMPYKVERWRLSFQCGTLQAKNDYKCNTWSRQKLSPQYDIDEFWINGLYLQNLISKSTPLPSNCLTQEILFLFSSFITNQLKSLCGNKSKR